MIELLLLMQPNSEEFPTFMHNYNPTLRLKPNQKVLAVGFVCSEKVNVYVPVVRVSSRSNGLLCARAAMDQSIQAGRQRIPQVAKSMSHSKYGSTLLRHGSEVTFFFCVK